MISGDYQTIRLQPIAICSQFHSLAIRRGDIGHFDTTIDCRVKQFLEDQADQVWGRAKQRMIGDGNIEQAEAMEKSGAGLEDLPYFMSEVGGTARVRIDGSCMPYREHMPETQYCGHGPLSFEIVFCHSIDGNGHSATHWELAQTWVTRCGVNFDYELLNKLVRDAAADA